MRTYGYWVEGPATVTGGIALEYASTTDMSVSTSRCGGTGAFESSSSNSATFLSRYHGIRDSTGETAFTTGYDQGETSATWIARKSSTYVARVSATGTSLGFYDWRYDRSFSATMTERMESSSERSEVTVSETDRLLEFGGATYRLTRYWTSGHLYTLWETNLSSRDYVLVNGYPVSDWTSTYSSASDASSVCDRRETYSGSTWATEKGYGISDRRLVYYRTQEQTVTQSGSRTEAGSYYYDKGTVETQTTFVGATTAVTTRTTTVASFSAGSTTAAPVTWTAKTSTTATLTSAFKSVGYTKTWAGADITKFLDGRMVLHTVYEVEESECIATQRGATFGFWAPGTTTRSRQTLGLAGGDYCSVTTESAYAGQQGCGTTTAGGSGFAYAECENTVTTATETTLDRATAEGTDTPPLDGTVGVSLSSGGSTTVGVTTYASSGPTYTYSYSGYGDKRSTMESAFTTSNGWLFRSMDPAGQTAWALSSYSGSASPYSMLVTGGTSGSRSYTYSRSTTRDTAGYRTSQWSTESGSSSSVGIGTTVWGQRYKSSIEKYTTYSADSYWTYTHDKTARNMLGFSLQCSDGFRGDRAQGVFSNLTADEYPPTLRDGQLYSTQACGGRVPAFRGSGVVTLNGSSYSTTHLSENSYLVSSSDWTAARTCVWNAAGDAKTYVSWKDYVDYAETNPPTIIGDGEDRTVSMMFQDWTRNSRMALAYTSVNTSAGGTTRSTTEYSPWYLTRDTTLSVGSQCQVAFRILPYALSSSGTGARLVSTTASFNLDGSSTIDLWTY